jgi:hypothetical protein
MAGEHLPLSNYDDLSADEIVSKLKILLRSGAPNIAAVIEYEQANQNRSGLLSDLEKLHEEAPPSPAEVPSTAGIQPEAPQVEGGTATIPDDLEPLNKSDLYEIAQQLDIPDRSKMEEDELREAIEARR